VNNERSTRFTSRQREVVELIAAGCSNDEIARRLGISARTAKAHCDVLRQKLGVHRRRQVPAAYRLLTGEDPLLPDTILRGEAMRRRAETNHATSKPTVTA
jgi:DNA-binding CsgD family transcriptional regulator